MDIIPDNCVTFDTSNIPTIYILYYYTTTILIVVG